jgi:hypothetical protein
MVETVRSLFLSLFQVDSIWSVVFRAGIWIGVAVVVMMSLDMANTRNTSRSLKGNLGLFLLFITLSCGLLYMLFGFTSRPA